MEEYKSFGSFAPVYIEARRALFDKFDTKIARPACAVFMELASHADSYGAGFCGIQRLAKLTHYSPTTVSHALELLSQLDYIRQQSSVDNFGRIKAFWQLSPFVLWVSPACIDAALKMWESGLSCIDFFTQNSLQLSRNLYESYTTTRTRETSFYHQNQTNQTNQKLHHQNSDEIAHNQHEVQSEIDPDNQHEVQSEIDPDNQHEVQSEIDPDNQHEVPNTQRDAQTGRKTAKPSVPPENVREIDFKRYAVPLSSASAEKVANELAEWKGGTRLPQARQTVEEYGWELVRDGMHQVAMMREVKNHQGLLRNQLKLGLLEKLGDWGL